MVVFLYSDWNSRVLLATVHITRELLHSRIPGLASKPSLSLRCNLQCMALPMNLCSIWHHRSQTFHMPKLVPPANLNHHLGQSDSDRPRLVVKIWPRSLVWQVPMANVEHQPEPV